jgi:hypothetical protein
MSHATGSVGATWGYMGLLLVTGESESWDIGATWSPHVACDRKRRGHLGCYFMVAGKSESWGYWGYLEPLMSHVTGSVGATWGYLGLRLVKGKSESWGYGGYLVPLMSHVTGSVGAIRGHLGAFLGRFWSRKKRKLDLLHSNQVRTPKCKH